MKTAKESAEKTIKRLERERMAWFEENAEDQADYLEILKAIEGKRTQISVIQREIEMLIAAKGGKEAEMVGENKSQIEKFDKLIEQAKNAAESV